MRFLDPFWTGFPGPANQDPAVTDPAEPASEGGQEARPPRDAVEKYGMPGKIKSGIHCLTIIGQVEGHLQLPGQNKTTKYEHIIPLLMGIEDNPEVRGLLIILNTVGGDVEAGLAIAEMISTMSKPNVSLVLGGGHSIGIPIAVAADYSFIASTATMTVHPVRLSGLVVTVPQTYEYLEKMQDRIVRFVATHSRISEAKYRELMFRTGELARDIGTVLVGKDAVSVGLIDEVGGLEQSLAKLREMIGVARTEAVVQ